MKIVNYNYGYFPIFNCSIHGKIVMTSKEWKEAYCFLLRGQKRWLPSYPWVAKILKEDEKRSIPTRKGSYLINIRVPATEALVERYKLHGYKRGNYMLEIIIL